MQKQPATHKQSVKDQIVTGLFIELASHPLSEIAIASLIKTAGVARASYYRNFDSKEDILNYYLDQLLNKNESPAVPTVWTRTDVTIKVTDIFQALEEEKDRFLLLFQSGLASYAFDYFSTFSSRNGIDSPFPWTDEYMLPFYSGALTSVLYHWLQTGAKQPAAELAEHFISLLPDSFFVDQQ